MSVHTYICCPDCKQDVRASKHTSEDCAIMARLQSTIDGVESVVYTKHRSHDGTIILNPRDTWEETGAAVRRVLESEI